MRSDLGTIRGWLLVPVIGLACVVSSAIAQTAKVQATTNDASPSTAQRIERVENGFAPIPLGENEPPLQVNLQKLMEVYKVPGLSVAVIDNFKIVWAKAYGVTEAGTATPVTTHTLFQAGSISKPVAATGALYLVEHGKLSLDEDVNRKLVSWKVPENEFTKDQKVTLRRLMSHSAGLTVHGFPGYAVDESIPSLVQIFNGEKPANTAPIRVDIVPGTKGVYSGGGITIEQQLVIDVTGEPFPQFMRETVLDKIGMGESTYEQPLPQARAPLAASGTYADGKLVRGKWHVYPEMAAAGLWTTPTDLARFAIEIALSRQGKANHVLSQAMTQQMLTPQIDTIGLGFFLGDKDNPGQFGHNGADEGFQAILTMFSDSGHGVAVMANSDNGITVANYVIKSIAREYAWNNTQEKEQAAGVLMLIADLRDARVAMRKYEDLKKTGSSEYEVNEGTLNQFGYHLLQSGRKEDAIQVFKRNVEEYPKSSNVYDSLGEAYMAAGQKDLAIQNYKKSIELDPKNQNGIDMLKKLMEQK
ncbi:MAG TPA: serine hydrolase [Candidatus Dormibacteraeota bacterium]|nr:serine hydrolase [Candidatus Dormibacteraeota bacterium]